MKRLLLIRHAKSSWDNTTLNDFDRPLNERGKKDAPSMAQRLVDRSITIDAFISSPAKRARKTAEAFAKKYQTLREEIILIDKLYIASTDIFNEVISEVDNSFETIAVFSHNPGITEFANSLTTARLDEMPTCSILGVTINGDDWADFNDAEKVFWFFDYPKSVEQKD